jgi:hypothetical protein
VSATCCILLSLWCLIFRWVDFYLGLFVCCFGLRLASALKVENLLEEPRGGGFYNTHASIVSLGRETKESDHAINISSALGTGISAALLAK